MRLLAVDFVIQLCRARPTVAILAPRGQPFSFSFFLGFRALFFSGVGCQVTSCTQSRLLRAELFVKGSRHRLSTIVRVVLIGRELVQFQHEKPFDCVNGHFKICKISAKSLANLFFQKIEIAEPCKGVHYVDLGESFQTHIFLQNLASIQPRTSPPKFAASAGLRRQRELEREREEDRRAVFLQSVSTENFL